MPRYSPEQIYGLARRAGFSPDGATTMTAVALAESGGNSRAHNPSGEDSRGLWQINARAHPHLAARYDLFDPLQNARAAFEVSRKGSDMSPWTVTHGGADARYLRYRDAAQAAAVANGDGPGRGVWTGTLGYGRAVAAEAPGAGRQVDDPDLAPSAYATTASSSDQPSAGGGITQRFLEHALAQRGDRYVFGAEARPDDPDPDRFDCSELVEWSARQVSVTVPDGASAQYLFLKERGLLVDVDEALRTPGALLFSFSSEPRPGGGRPSTAHVAISLGDGRTIEARNSRLPVDSFDAGNRFTYAGVIPGISDPASLAAVALDEVPDSLPGGGIVRTVSSGEAPPDLAPVSPPPPADLGGADTDDDGVTDAKERAEGLDPLSADTDQDRLLDGWELVHGSDPRSVDGDGDGLLDAFEFPRGSDPADPDVDRDGHLDGALPEAWLDTDRDHVDDALERLRQLDPSQPDSDRDGWTDGLEHRSGPGALEQVQEPAAGAGLEADDLALWASS